MPYLTVGPHDKPVDLFYTLHAPAEGVPTRSNVLCIMGFLMEGHNWNTQVEYLTGQGHNVVRTFQGRIQVAVDLLVVDLLVIVRGSLGHKSGCKQVGCASQPVSQSEHERNESTNGRTHPNSKIQ
jgi:hypothetical protein